MRTMKNTKDGDLARLRVLITGGSRGIGLELAKQFAQRGHDLVVVGRDETELRRAANELEGQYRCTVTPVSLDLVAHDAPTVLLHELDAQGIHIDVLVNNAGTGDYGPFAGQDPERLSAMVRLNTVSLTNLTRAFLPRMIERGRGRILNVSSLVAFFAGGANWAGYVASKQYVLALTRGLRGELSGTGVTVTALCPGPTETDFVARSGLGGIRVYRWLPKIRPSAVACAGYRAAMAGRAVAVPGVLNKVLAFLGELPPRSIAQAVFAFLSRGGRVADGRFERSTINE